MVFLKILKLCTINYKLSIVILISNKKAKLQAVVIMLKIKKYIRALTFTFRKNLLLLIFFYFLLALLLESSHYYKFALNF
jgi:hypothetical protein